MRSTYLWPCAPAGLSCLRPARPMLLIRRGGVLMKRRTVASGRQGCLGQSSPDAVGAGWVLERQPG
jgi:hypothetical protein